MKVLLIGSGGREHALAWKIKQSSLVKKLIVSPGGSGISMAESLDCLPIKDTEIVEFCLREKVDFVVIGPDQALADGLVDRLQENAILCFGPTKAAAELEWSKAFAKDLMNEIGVPTAKYKIFTELAQASAFVENSDWSGWVVKADGLALGKGVVVAREKKLALEAIQSIQEQVGAAAKKILIEQVLVGREVSAFYLCDGKDGVLLSTACDHKQLRDGGVGPNTGGMGAYSPASWLTQEQLDSIQTKVVNPVLIRMQSLGRPFHGVLFVGLMMTEAGPYVLEFNARFGDPETQALMPRIKSDLVPYLIAAANGKLAETIAVNGDLELFGSSVHVVLAAHGYPGTEGIPVRKGDQIKIDAALWRSQNPKVFFAGVSEKEGSFFTNGGRVLGVTALAETQENARKQAYAVVEKIAFQDKQFRGDIGR